MPVRHLLLAALATAAVLPAQLSGSYLIDPSATPPNFNSIQAAATAAMTAGISGPVVFSIFPGTYTESVAIGPIPGASATTTVTFQALVPGTVRLIGATTDTVAFTGGAVGTLAGWVVFDGLEFDSAPGAAISGGRYTYGVEIRNCKFGPNHRGPSRDNLIYSDNQGVETGWNVHHNTFTFPNRVSRTAYGVYLSNGGDWSFHHNTIDLNGCNYGLYLINQNRRLDRIYNNVFTGSLAPGSGTSASSVAVIKADVSNYDNDIVHNTFVVSPGANGCCVVTRGLSGGNATNRMYGNIFVIVGPGTAIVVNASTSLPNPYLGDGNVFWAPAGEIGRLTPTGAGIVGLANWQAATGQDAGSVEADPLFLNGGTAPYDLRLQPNSPAIGRALNTPAYVTAAMAGRLRDAQPDAGAFEGAGFATFGMGCAGTGALVPQIGSVGTVAPGSATFGVTLQNALPGALCLLWGGGSRTMSGPQTLPFPIGGGCAIQASPDAIVFNVSSGAGTASLPIGIPMNPVFIGTDLNFQWGVLDAGSVSPLGITVSDGGVLQL